VPSQWSASDIVYVPNGVIVTIDGVYSTPFKCLLNLGVVTHNPSVNTAIAPAFILSGTDYNTPNQPQGEYCMGTPAAPIQSGVTAQVNFADLGPFAAPLAQGEQPLFPADYAADQACGGLLSMGILSVVGAPVVPYLTMQPVAAGATNLTLSQQMPTGWAAGQVLLLPGDTSSAHDEKVTIQSISGNVVTLTAPTLYAHNVPANAPAGPYVANTFRNAQFNSTATVTTHRHHFMQMHSDACKIEYAGFYGLGRTDKSISLDDGTNGLPATNHRGRYGAPHLHRCMAPGITQGDAAILVQGCYTEKSPGWGFVNHSSFVDFESNVGYAAFGSSFVDEAGNEYSTYNQNLLVSDVGVTVTPPSNIANFVVSDPNLPLGDFGRIGGFWFESPGATVTNNVALNVQVGFAIYTNGLRQKGINYNPPYENTFYWNNLNLPVSQSLTQNVPFAKFDGNVAGNVTLAILDQWQLTPDSGNTFTNFTAWNVGFGGIAYDIWAFNNKLVNAKFHMAPGAGRGVTMNPAYSRGEIFDGITVDGGAAIAVILSATGMNQINGGTFDAPIAFHQPATTNTAFSVTQNLVQNSAVYGNVTYGPQVQTQFDMATYDFVDQTAWKYTSGSVGNNPHPDDTVFLRSFQLLRPDGKQVFFAFQAPSFVTFPTNNNQGKIPAALIGLTNQQMFNAYGLCPCAGLASADAVTDPTIANGLVGSAQPAPVGYQMTSPGWTPATSAYTLKYKTTDTQGNNTFYTWGTTFTIVQGVWNLLTISDSLGKHSFFVWGQ
jgi:hypothetical protein